MGIRLPGIKWGRRALMGTPNMEPQEHSRNIIEHKDPGGYILIIFLLFSWGSLFGLPSKVPLWGGDPHCKSYTTGESQSLSPAANQVLLGAGGCWYPYASNSKPSTLKPSVQGLRFRK